MRFLSLPFPRFRPALLRAGLLLMVITGPGVALAENEPGRGSVAEILDVLEMRRNPGQRAEAVREVRQLQENAREAARALARDRGMPLRLELPDGGLKEVQAVDDGGELLYFFTHNDMAAISTGADVLRDSPRILRGNGLRVGMWDGGSGRTSHQEFVDGNGGSRMVNMNQVASIDHATHVGGTLAAAGVVARAQGMAPEAEVFSFDWNNDKAEMIEYAADGVQDEAGLYISNHSYGIITGWFRTGGTNPAFIWYGSGTDANAVDPRFGTYNTFARDTDAIAYDAPYYLIVRSAGNDRTDNPAAGQIVQLSPSSTSTVTYDPALHPAGDGIYRNGFDTLGFDAVAKNALTVGSVTDAVSGGRRNLSVATVSNFSSWGPTDDGRIKPDVVANGQGVYSTRNGDTAYSTLSGTSMSAPNATGTALLLIELYRKKFDGYNMLSSTLRGLLIHTADDLGTPGPNYSYGWGLINGVRAAELIEDHAEHPERQRLTESALNRDSPSFVHEFVWDGESPIRATLAWTDPPGTATTTGDLRSPRLRNNLDLRIIGPDNTVYLPFVMPFVGTWTVESMALPATTGVNNTDNVEQVYISEPTEGVYRIEVTYQGTLVDNEQVFSLLLDGSTGDNPPPPPLAILEISPAVAFSGSAFTMTLSGRSLEPADAVRLERSDSVPIHATNLRMSGGQLLADFDLGDAAVGFWDVVVSGNDETAILQNSFTVQGAIWSENFDAPPVVGWVSQSVNNIGSNGWTLTTDNPHSPPNAYFAPGPATRSLTALVSPEIQVPEEAQNLQFRFWHRFNFEFRNDGGRLEYALNGGAWTGVETETGPVRLVSNGYTNTILGRGPPAQRNPLTGLQAWTGNSGGYVESVIQFADDEAVAGKTLQFRWLLGTNNDTASPGWHVDSMVLLAEVDLLSQAPVITRVQVPDADTEVINEGTEEEETRFLIYTASAPLTVEVDSGTDEESDSEPMTYTWNATGPEPAFFSRNGTENADSTQVSFEAAGLYQINVTVTNAQGLSSVSAAFLDVRPQASRVRVQPESASLEFEETLDFSANLIDQFEEALSLDPEFTWSASAGTISKVGRYDATAAGENITVTATTATGETLSGTAQITVLPAPATVNLEGLEAIFDGEPKPVTVTTDPPDLAVSVTYDGKTEAPSEVGDYPVEAVIIHPNYSGIANGTLSIQAAVSLYENLMIRLERTPGGFALRINQDIPEGTFEVYSSSDLQDWKLSRPLTSEESSEDNSIELPPWDPEDPPVRFFRLQSIPSP